MTTAVPEVSVSVVTPAHGGGSPDHVKSSWLVKRLFDAFADAVVEQSNEAGIPGNRSKSMISYCISPFALLCMLTATILNRIVIFASTRTNKRLPKASKILLRLTAIYLLMEGAYGLLAALKLYTQSPLLKKLIPRYYDFDRDTFASYTFLGLSYSPEYFARTTIYKGEKTTFYGPTPAILKPFYLALCLSQVLETFIAVTSGSEPCIENGLTLFEYSLAFQEVQTANRPSTELLLIAATALAHQLNIHLLGLFDKQKYRLVFSVLIGTFTLTLYTKTFISGRITYMPFTVVMGYLPQMITLLVIMSSLLIFLLAALFKGSFSDLTFSTLTQHLDSIDVSLADDFYTALINMGTFVINAASKQSYVKEFDTVKVPATTYLEAAQPGYGRKVDNHPELAAHQLQQRKKQSKLWMVMRRTQDMRRLLFGFAKMLGVLVWGPLSVADDDRVVSDVREEDWRRLREHNAQMLLSERVNVDELDEQQLQQNYAQLLLSYQLSDFDSSADYSPEFLESESELEDESGAENELAQLVSAQDLESLVDPRSPEEIQFARILQQHLHSSSTLTRRRFSENYAPDLRLMDLIREKRVVQDADLGNCVICHVNARQVILWPCKCLAICESCRVSLFVRNFNECVCCRSKVDGYSKVYIP
ncbi:hypothetical protein KL905_002452 [Ogataea polymorpha]|nr:hypothetical protein KL907_002196 [Ogataea polymorpha]KAG7909803.1 hypothetical protein KL906_001708 [Ogataea polymorpha]KAG7917503.1 hypothetical protein KL927_002246 [Ogataea polymorpha]KAG7921687.1 hypothetical protein KL905_002452 [Ogataea polymorpha]